MWNIKFQIPKERTEKYWPRLLKSKQRPPSLVVDWPNWIEDTDDDDGGVSKLAYDDDDDRDDTAAPAKKAAPKPPADAVPGAGLASSVAGETASSKPKTKAPPVAAAKPKGRGGGDDDDEDEAEPAVRLPPPLHFDL